MKDPSTVIERNTCLNVLAETATSNGIVKITACPKAKDRLELVGGYENVLALMTKYHIGGHTKVSCANFFQTKILILCVQSNKFSLCSRFLLLWLK